MYKLFFFLAVFSSFLSYMNLDPMKSCFFLIFSLIFSMPLMSFFLHVWFSYFVCLLFLSGIFVILVYFSSLSKINLVKSQLTLFSLFLTLFFMFPMFLFESKYLNLNAFYYEIYWSMLFFILLVLLFFMNFSSYYLSFSGALRKI
uniref:NADH dehydrogenase subunit 6 n=1 Tax=Cruznema tripartitum TaxID=53474 RepID=UPI0023D7CA65|nr:NADH dehydrogenase subunit 6 [Cruznema tripartitum]WCR50917.1 NADH dehydrogenase subunit 6 [Cruznema tripartitum]